MKINPMYDMFLEWGWFKQYKIEFELIISVKSSIFLPLTPWNIYTKKKKKSNFAWERPP